MLLAPQNVNYSATIVKIQNIQPLDNCDYVVSSVIFGFPVIVTKNTQIGDIGVYFPPETQLSEKYCYHNNLYRNTDLNYDKTQKGYMEATGRVRTVKFRGNQSVGLFMPLSSLDAFVLNHTFSIGDTFDEIGGQEICKKYVIKKLQAQTPGKKAKTRVKESKVLDTQFRFHVDTANLGRNAHVVKPNDIITITKKLHGTSVVCSKILCKKKLPLKDKIAKWLGVNVIETEYDNIYSSRKVIKNDDINLGASHFYNVDIWGEANNRIQHALQDGISIYAEIVGYTAENTPIQSLNGNCYDYGCSKGTFEVYVYRITYTSSTGHVYEFSSKQLQAFCQEYNILAVPELYHGTARALCEHYNKEYTNDTFGDVFVTLLRELYLEKDCSMCSVKLPDEGIVVRLERNYIDAYKLKSVRFLEGETKEMDKGNSNLEDEG